MHAPRRFRRRARGPAAWLLVPAFALWWGAARAEPLPEVGTFDGVFHVDRWGGASVGFLRIPADLRLRFEGMEGKPVRVEVVRGRQYCIPGPVHVLELGTVTRVLDDPQVSVVVALFPESPRVGDRLQALVSVRNEGRTPVEWSPHALSSELVREKSSAGAPAAPPPATPSLERSSSLCRSPGRGLSAAVRLAFGDSVSLPLESRSAVEAGRYELQVGVHVGERSFVTWVPFDVLGAEEPRAGRFALPLVAGIRAEGFSARPGATTTASWGVAGLPILILEGRLVADQTQGLRLAWGRDQGGRTTALEVHAYDDRGAEVPLSTWTRIGDGPFLENARSTQEAWTLEPLPADGLPLRVELRPRRAFSPRPPWKFVAEIDTDRGPACVELATDDAASLASPAAAYGPRVGGIRLRARAEIDPLPAGGPLRVLFEVVNEAGTPLIVLPAESWAEHVVADVDGKEVRVATQDAWVVGWAAQHVVGEPQDGAIRLDSVPLAPGEHVVRVGIRSGGGTYVNTLNEKVPVFTGEVWSAPTPFRVK